MRRRVAVGAGIILFVVLVVPFLVMFTDVGARLALRTLLPIVNGRLNGSVTVGAARGPIVRGIELDNVILVDSLGTVLATAHQVRLEYRLRDLIAKRWIMQRMVLTRPTVDLVQERPGESVTLMGVVRASAPAPSQASYTVELRNVAIEHGSVTYEQKAPRSREPSHTRRFSDLDGMFPVVQFALDESAVPTVTVRVRDFTGTHADSALVVRAAAGRIDMYGDSVALEFSEIGLVESRLTVRGWVAFREGGPEFDVTLAASPLVTDELRSFSKAVPAGLVGTGDVRVRMTTDRAVDVEARQFEVQSVDRTERVRGRVGVQVDAEGRWVQRGTRVEFANVNLERLESFVPDTLPVAGRVTGVVALDGPQDGLEVEIDGVFRDASVRGQPRSSLTGGGTVRLVGDVPRVSRFRVERSSVDLATIGRFVPTGALGGVVRFGGTVNGSLDSAHVVGRLAHLATPNGATVLRGSIRMERRSGPLRLHADIDVDSVQPATLRAINSDLEALVPLTGHVSVDGRLDSLEFSTRFKGPAGEADGRGVLAITEDRVELLVVDGGVSRLDLALLRTALPPSTIYGRGSGRAVLRPQTDREWVAQVALDSSTVQGVRLDSVRTVLAGIDSLVRVDTLRVWGDHVWADGAGTLALFAPQQGSYRVEIRSDSIGAFESWVSQWLSDVASDSGSVSGSLLATVSGVGSFEHQELTVQFQGRDLRRGRMAVADLRGSGSWETSTRQFTIDARADSARVGSLTMRTATALARGRPESFDWTGALDLYTEAALSAVGSAANNEGAVITVDSLVADLGASRWAIDTAVSLTLRDSTIEVSQLNLTNSRGPGRITLSGQLPAGVPGTLTARLQQVQIADVVRPLGPDFSETEGALEGTLELTGTAARPRFDLDFVLRDGAYKTFRTSLVEGSFRYDERQLDGTFTVRAQGRQLVTVSGRAPLDLALEGVDARRISGDLEIRAVADSVGLDMLEPFMSEMARNIRGIVVADVTVRGGWAQPDLSGQLRLTEGAATLPALGVRHRAAEAELALSGNTIRVSRAVLTSGSGTVNVTGSATVADLTDPDLDLRLQARDFRLIDRPDLLTMTTSADVTLRGPISGATLAGRGTATRGNLYATDLLEKQVVNLADTMFAAYVDTTVLRAEAVGSFATLPFVRALSIDTLRFRLGSDVWMRSSEADVQLVGDVSVIKRGDDYRLNGTLSAARGVYRLQLGPAVKRDFVVTRGEIRFLGTPDLNADLDIDTEHQVRSARGTQVTVNAHLGGTVYQPRLSLSSDVQPPLSETEIVSYLLFGAPSVQAFAGSGGNQGRFVFQQSVDRFANVLAGEIERSLLNGLGVPLDYLQIRPGEFSRGFSGTEIALGKQLYLLGRPVFLVASPRLCAEQLVSTRNLGASLEFRITRKWLIAASVDPLRACEVSTTQSLTRYQLGGDIFWETGR